MFRFSQSTIRLILPRVVLSIIYVRTKWNFAASKKIEDDFEVVRATNEMETHFVSQDGTEIELKIN